MYGCETWSLTLREERRLRVFNNRVLRRILGPNREEVTGEWRKLHNEDLYCSPNIFWMIKSRRMRLAEHVARMGVRKGVYRVLWRNLREREHLQSLGLGRIIILKWIFRKCDVGAWTGLIWLRIGTGGGLL